MMEWLLGVPLWVFLQRAWTYGPQYVLALIGHQLVYGPGFSLNRPYHGPFREWLVRVNTWVMRRCGYLPRKGATRAEWDAHYERSHADSFAMLDATASKIRAKREIGS